MSRSQLVLLVVLVASSINVNAQEKNRDRYFDDFRGQRFCANRQRTPEGTCCASRIDECSVPIAGENSYQKKVFKINNQMMIVFYFKAPCATVMSSVINTLIQIAVPITKMSAKVDHHQLMIHNAEILRM